MARTIEVILKEDIPNLGIKGEIVRVRPGYARNFLIPKGMAAPATLANKRWVERMQAEAEARRRAMEELAKSLKERLQAVRLIIPMRAGSEGQLYGSVTPAIIAEKLAEHQIEVDRRKITIAHEIKTLGIHTAQVHLPSGEEVSIVVEVKPEEE